MAINIYDVLNMTINQAIEFFTKYGQKKIVKKLQPLQDVGLLGYIKLGQSSSTLSGGENQRETGLLPQSGESRLPCLSLTSLPFGLRHFHDIKKLLEAFDALIRRGPPSIMRHNLDVVKCADYVMNLGPEGGDKGGNIVAEGTPEEVARCA